MNRSSENGVLLDTNVVIAHVDPSDQHHDTAEDQLRLVALTAEKLLITSPTASELFRWIEYRSRDVAFVGDNKAVLRNLEEFLKNPSVERVSVDAAETPEWGPELKRILHQLEASRPDPRSSIVSQHDAFLILSSRSLGVPILTFDRVLQSVAPTRLADVTLPCPFDPSELRKVDVQTVMDLATPLRSIYKSAFGTLRTQAQQIEAMRSDTAGLDASFRASTQRSIQQANKLRELEEQIQEAIRREEFWRNAARPDLSQTIAWTLVEAGLSFLGVPVPTSPMAYLIDIIRYQQRLRRLDPAGGNRP